MSLHFQHSPYVALQQTRAGKFCFYLLRESGSDAGAAFMPAGAIFNP